MAQVILDPSNAQGDSFAQWFQIGANLVNTASQFALQQRQQAEVERLNRVKTKAAGVQQLADAAGKDFGEYLIEDQKSFNDLFKEYGFDSKTIDSLWSQAQSQPITVRQILRDTQNALATFENPQTTPESQRTQQAPAPASTPQPLPQPATPPGEPEPQVGGQAPGAAQGPLSNRVPQTGPSFGPSPQGPGPRGTAVQEATTNALAGQAPMVGMGSLRASAEPSVVTKNALAAQEARQGRATYSRPQTGGQAPTIAPLVKPETVASTSGKALVEKADTALQATQASVEALVSAPDEASARRAGAQASQDFSKFKGLMGRVISRPEYKELQSTEEGRAFLRESLERNLSDPAWRAAYLSLNPEAADALAQYDTEAGTLKLELALRKGALDLAQAEAQARKAGFDAARAKTLAEAAQAATVGTNPAQQAKNKILQSRLSYVAQTMKQMLGSDRYQWNVEAASKNPYWKSLDKEYTDIYTEFFGFPPTAYKPEELPGLIDRFFTFVGASQGTQAPQGPTTPTLPGATITNQESEDFRALWAESPP